MAATLSVLDRFAKILSLLQRALNFQQLKCVAVGKLKNKKFALLKHVA